MFGKILGKLVRTIKRRYLLLVVIGSLIVALRVAEDPDLWWHLAVGRYIVLKQKIPTRDLFSFSMSNYPYVYHSWLTEVVLFLIFRQFGLWEISIFYAVLAVLTIYILARKE